MWDIQGIYIMQYTELCRIYKRSFVLGKTLPAVLLLKMAASLRYVEVIQLVLQWCKLRWMMGGFSWVPTSNLCGLRGEKPWKETPKWLLHGALNWTSNEFNHCIYSVYPEWTFVNNGAIWNSDILFLNRLFCYQAKVDNYRFLLETHSCLVHGLKWFKKEQFKLINSYNLHVCKVFLFLSCL